MKNNYVTNSKIIPSSDLSSLAFRVKTPGSLILIALFIILGTIGSWAQLPTPAYGDYRSDGNVTVGSAVNWDTYNGSVWSPAGSQPSSGGSFTIWIQSGQSLTIGGAFICKNLCLSTGTDSTHQSAPGALAIGGSILSISGSMYSFYAAVVSGTTDFGTLTPTTGLTSASYNITSSGSPAGGYIQFAGATPTVAGAWSGLCTTTWTAYFTNSAPIMGTDFSCASIGMPINGTFNLTFPSGTTFTLYGSSASFLRSEDETITIANGATWNYSGTSDIGTAAAAQGTYIINGIMNCGYAGAQNVPPNLTVGTTGELILSGSGTKTWNGLLNINGKVSLQGTATVSNEFATDYYGAGSTLEYAGNSLQTVGAEWPATGIISSTGTIPDSIRIGNFSHVTLPNFGSYTYQGTLNFAAGDLELGTGSASLTLSNSTFASQVSGAYNSTNYIVTNGSGTFTRNFAPASSITYFIGSTTSDCSPVIVTPASSTDISVAVAPLTLSVKDATRCVNKQWSVTAGIGGATCTLVPEWRSPADEEVNFVSSGGHSTTDLGNWNGSAWTIYTSITPANPSFWQVSQSGLTVPYGSSTNQYVVGDVGEISGTVSVNNYASPETEIKIYPNPASNQITVYNSLFLNGATLDVYNLLGEKMLSTSQIFLNGDAETVDVSSFAKGIYFLQVKTDRGVVTKRFVKQ